ncbi:MAG: TusE/DsrC/DsvC family sulfur relay protein [Pseudomonadales bacterium]
MSDTVKLNVDKEGFLRNLSDWNEEIAAELARLEGIELGEDHWEIIYLVRDYYNTYRISPSARVLVKVVGERLGSEKGRSIHLMKLFSGRPARVVSKVSGLPKPSNCD